MRAFAADTLASAALLCCAGSAAAEPPWQAADAIRAELFEAQTQQLFEERGGDAVAAGGSAPRRRRCAAGSRQSAPAELREIRALAAAKPSGRSPGSTKRGWRPPAGGSSPPCAGAHSRLPSTAARRGEAARARSWMQIRDFRQTTRFTRPGVDGTAALQQLAAGEIIAA